VVRELFRLLKESKARAGLTGDIDLHPFGLAALRPGLALAIEYSCQQGLLRRKLEVEELFDDVTIGLE
jgi:4,5-dihydroxyphthalate decarboxylase